MRLPQFSVRTLLIVVFMVALYFPCEKRFRKWISDHHALAYVTAVLHSELEEGDSFASVTNHFDSYRLLTTTADSEYLANLKTICSRKGMLVLSDDEFYHLTTASGQGAYLQFREGRLVNLWNSAFIDARKFPNQYLEIGYLRSIFNLSYVLVFVTVLVIDIHIQRRKRRKNATRSEPLLHPSLANSTLTAPS